MANRRRPAPAILDLNLMATTAVAASPDPLKTRPAFSPDAKPKLVLVGDPTVTDDAGWGGGFQTWLGGKAECINLSRGGRSSDSFVAEGRWAQALALKPDYVLIQLGHNDEPGHSHSHGPGRESDPATTYKANVARDVDEAARRAVVVTADGTGEFRTVQEAIAATTATTAKRWRRACRATDPRSATAGCSAGWTRSWRTRAGSTTPTATSKAASTVARNDR